MCLQVWGIPHFQRENPMGWETPVLCLSTFLFFLQDIRVGLVVLQNVECSSTACRSRHRCWALTWRLLALWRHQAFTRKCLLMVADSYWCSCRWKVSGKHILEKWTSSALLGHGSSDPWKLVSAQVLSSWNSWHFRCSFLGVLWIL